MAEPTTTDYVGFTHGYPVWVYVNEPLTRSNGLPAGLELVNVDDMGHVGAVFTDEPTAEQFVLDSGRPHTAAAPLGTPGQLLAYAEALEAIGVRHVGFDFPHPDSGRRERGFFCRIEHMRAVLSAG